MGDDAVEPDNETIDRSLGSSRGEGGAEARPSGPLVNGTPI